jgi:hypothetical protein
MVFSGTTAARDVIIVKKNPFTPDEILRADADATQFEARRRADVLDYVSQRRQIPVTTDDRPVLFLISKSDADERLQDTRQYTRPVPLWALVGGFLLGILLLVFRYTTGRSWRRVMPSFFFIGISAGLATLEYVCINKATLILGNPIYAGAIATGVLMVSAGLGGLLAARFGLRRYLPMIAWSAAGILLVYYALASSIDAAITLPTALRVALIAFVAAVPGFIAGSLFPLAFQAVREHDEPLALWFWGIDAIAFVVASLAIAVIAGRYGIHTTALLGAAGYAVAALFSRTFTRGPASG